MNTEVLAREIDNYLQRLFPINRSLTGVGNRKTFEILGEIVPINITEYRSGSKVYDWSIPDEWTIRNAYIKSPSGKKLVDFNKCNLHVVGYSTPIHQHMTFDELAPRLHMLSSNPEAIPYRTNYYNRDWGFCVTGAQFQELKNISGLLEVCIESELNSDGGMTIGELRIPGMRSEEYLVSTYCCHPSMANDNLSGLLVAAYLARNLLDGNTPFWSWRFIFVPETIGAIAYLCNNDVAMRKIRGGFVVTTCGGPGEFGYKESFVGNHLIDRSIRTVFRDRNIEPLRYRFIPDGSDERQYSSPGFRIPVATITRNKYYEYPQYHTSLDNLDFVNGDQIVSSLELYEDAIYILNHNRLYRSTVPNGEPRLGSRGLYPMTGGGINQIGFIAEDGQNLDAIGWLLFLADGDHTLIDIAERSELPFALLLQAANCLTSHGLLE